MSAHEHNGNEAVNASPAQVDDQPFPYTGLSFEELSRRYNFRNTAPRRPLFTELVMRELEARPTPRSAIDIGCGRGIGREVRWTRAIRRHVEEFWGVEPDEDIRPEEGLFDHFQHGLMETADLPENAFDVAYSHMVMEHVEEPRPFLEAVHRCLKPGGRYYFITPNGRHYFALTTLALKRLRLEDLALRLVRGQSGYHYPVMYRCNTPAAIDPLAKEIGFEKPEYVFSEQRGPAAYLKGPLRPLFHALNLKRRMIHKPHILLDLIVRLTKPQEAPAPR